MNAETLKKPWVIALLILAAIGLLAVGFFGSRLILGRQFRDGNFPRGRLGAVPGFGGGEGAGGEILAVNDAQLSIESIDGEVLEFSINDETEIFVDGGLDALEVGAFAFVQYESADDGSLMALFIGNRPEGGAFRIGPAGGGGRGPAGGEGGGGRGQQ